MLLIVHGFYSFSTVNNHAGLSSQEWSQGALGDDLFPCRLMFAQAVTTPTHTFVKEICCFAEVEGCSGWLCHSVVGKHCVGSLNRKLSLSQMSGICFPPETTTVLFIDVFADCIRLTGGEDGPARLLWKVFPSISCSLSERCHGWLTGRRRHRQRAGDSQFRGEEGVEGVTVSLPPAAPPPPTPATVGLQKPWARL